jgi:hypothetical protein
MAKLIILSIIFFTVGVPIAMSTRPAPRRTVRTIQILTVVYIFIWAYMCLNWYPQLTPLDSE